jgi:dihydrofolate reductase
MGKIVVTEFISLDGIVEDPGGAEAGSPAGWTAFDRGAEGDQLKLAELDAADAQLLGRVTYDGFAAAWPAIDDAAGFGAKMNAMPKYVVSKTLHDPVWNNTTVLSVTRPRRSRRSRTRWCATSWWRAAPGWCTCWPPATSSTSTT